MDFANRREFLGGCLASLGVSPLIAQDAVKEPELAAGWIDAHSHIWTPDTVRYPLAHQNTKADLKPASFTFEELLKTARPYGVGRVVLIQHHQYYGWDNSYMTDAAQQHPQVFRVVGMVNDASPNPDQQMRSLQKQHVTGFRITSLATGAESWLTNPGMLTMWRCAVETRQPMCCLIMPKDLPIVDRMCERLPETPVVIDHFGRVGIDGEIRETDLRQLCRLARHKHTYVKVSAYYALGKKEPPYDDLAPMIKRVVEAFGPQRLMWASDCPYQLGGANSYGASIALIRERLPFLSDKDQTQILRDTADRVYFRGQA